MKLGHGRQQPFPRVQRVTDTNTRRKRVRHRVGHSFLGRTQPLLSDMRRGHCCGRRRPKTKTNRLNSKRKRSKTKTNRLNLKQKSLKQLKTKSKLKWKERRRQCEGQRIWKKKKKTQKKEEGSMEGSVYWERRKHCRAYLEEEGTVEEETSRKKFCYIIK